MITNDFYKFAQSEKGVSSLTLDCYTNVTMGGGYINPYILEERKLNAVPLDIFSRLQADRIIFLGVPIDDDVANIIQAQLLYLSNVDPKQDISLYINSPGGVVTSGYAILDTMQLIDPKVATICTGSAASMAAVILCSGEKGKRSILPHSRVLIHQPLGGTSGQVSDMEIDLKEIQKMKKELISIIATNTGQSLKKVTADCDRDYWMSAQEALDYGMVDKILTKKK